MHVLGHPGPGLQACSDGPDGKPIMGHLRHDIGHGCLASDPVALGAAAAASPSRPPTHTP